jgi:hypothetical protein
MEVETKHQESKSNYDKVAITLEMDKQSLEKECDAFQVIPPPSIEGGVMCLLGGVLKRGVSLPHSQLPRLDG